MLFAWNSQKPSRKVHVLRENGETLCKIENSSAGKMNEVSEAIPAKETLCGNCKSRLEWASAVNKKVKQQTQETVVPFGKQGIPTVYEQQQFRSRLEAKWARFFDLAGWKWTYEPFDCDGWIPDFALHGQKSMTLVEVKPIDRMCWDTAAKIDRACPKIRGGEALKHEILLLGMCVPLMDVDNFHNDELILGYLCTMEIAWTNAIIGRWESQKNLGFCSDTESFSDRISGQYDGGCWGGAGVDPQEIQGLWRQAANLTQWKRP